jgi:atrazine chlorohydrolase/5-methylthioadenosine/S-adenosylhomocysteine deaminase/melamine deaminase
MEDAETALQRIEDLMAKYNSPADRLIQVWPAPGIPAIVTREGLIGSLELARKFGTMVTIHLAETEATSRWNGTSITEYLDDIGFLHPSLSAAHCVWMNDKDLRLLKRNDVKIVNNVVSNMFLGSGIAPVTKMHDLGLCVGLGTDDVNCNNSANMLSDLKFTALAQKAKYLDAAAMTAEKALEMATIDGAKAIGMEKEIGSLEPGKQADLIILDMDQPHLTPCHHIPSTLVYQARGTEVESVMVNGKWLIIDRLPQFLKGPSEIKKLMTDVQKASLRVIKNAGMDHMANRRWSIE